MYNSSKSDNFSRGLGLLKFDTHIQVAQSVGEPAAGPVVSDIRGLKVLQLLAAEWASTALVQRHQVHLPPADLIHKSKK